MFIFSLGLCEPQAVFHCDTKQIVMSDTNQSPQCPTSVGSVIFGLTFCTLILNFIGSGRYPMLFSCILILPLQLQSSIKDRLPYCHTLFIFKKSIRIYRLWSIKQWKGEGEEWGWKEKCVCVCVCIWGLSVVRGGLVERYTRCENDFCNMSSKQQTAGDLLEITWST